MGSARHVAIISMLSLSLIVSVRQTAVAQQLKSQEEALRIINDFADRFCPKIPLAGSSSAVDLSGSVKAELPGLLKKIADLGFKAAARYQQSQYQGVLQKDLLAAMRDSTDCKLTVLESLKGKLLSAPARLPEASRPSVLIEPVMNLTIGKPFGHSTVITVKNSGVEDIVDGAVNLRCFLLRTLDDQQPLLFFVGYETLDSTKSSWWSLGRVGPTVVRTKDARDFLDSCWKNKKNGEQSQGIQYVRTFFAADLIYRRSTDRKQYRLSDMVSVLEDGQTGGPALVTLPGLSNYHRHLLQTVTTPTNVKSSN